MSSNTPSIVAPQGAPLPLARVPFRGGFIEAAQIDGDVFVPLRPLCDRLGVSAQGQLAKLRAKPWACIKMILSQVPGDDQARLLAAVDLRSLPLWLATIEPSRVKPEARAALVAYQREAAGVLARHFLANKPPSTAIVPAKATVPAKVDRVEAEIHGILQDRIAVLQDQLRAQQEQIRKLQARAVPRAELTALRYQLKHLEELQAFAIAQNVTPAKEVPPPVELTEELVQKVWKAAQRFGAQRFTAGQIKVKYQGRKLGRANDTAAALAVLVARHQLTPTPAKHGRAFFVSAQGVN